MTYPLQSSQWTAQQQSAAGPPSVPSAVTSIAMDSGAVVSWNHAGDHSVTGFTVTGTPGGSVTVNGAARMATVTGLANSTSYTFTVHATNAAGSSAESPASGSNTPLANLIFGDDFTGSFLDPHWLAYSRAGDQSAPETDWLLPSQVSLDGASHLLLTAVAAPITASQYTGSNPPAYTGGAPLTLPYRSGAVQWRWPGQVAPSQGMAVSGFAQPGFNFLYGKIQVSMMASSLAGVNPGGGWPSAWMLGAQCQPSNAYDPDNVGTSNWPSAGSEEIDIAQYVGGNVAQPQGNYIYGAGNNGSPAYSVNPTTPTTAFNTYETQWSAGSLDWALNGSVMAGLHFGTSIASTPQFLMLNNAMRGTVTAFTQPVMSVDWVRVFHN